MQMSAEEKEKFQKLLSDLSVNSLREIGSDYYDIRRVAVKTGDLETQFEMIERLFIIRESIRLKKRKK